MSSLKRREFLHRSLCTLAGSAAFGSMFGKMSLANATAPTLLGSGSDLRGEGN